MECRKKFFQLSEWSYGMPKEILLAFRLIFWNAERNSSSFPIDLLERREKFFENIEGHHMSFLQLILSLKFTSSIWTRYLKSSKQELRLTSRNAAKI
jgi:hypothetical protein